MATQTMKMDRGSDALKTHASGCQQMDIRQTRRGWLQECLGCEAKTEFKYFKDGTQFAHSLEDTDCCCRVFCPPIHPYKMTVTELNTDAELLTVDRPLNCCVGSCKCCCYQEMSVTSGGQYIGSVKEGCYYCCVARFTAFDEKGEPLYKIHNPSCCGGMCPQCCAEGNPCFGKGCCKVPFHIFPATQEKTDGGAPNIGKILKAPKSWKTEAFTDANAFLIDFPEGSSSGEKALLMGTAIFFNSIFFEGDDSSSGGGGD